MSTPQPVEGKSRLGFSFATRDSVKRYKKQNGHKNGQRVRVRIVDQFVEFENPVRDYIVVLGPGD